MSNVLPIKLVGANGDVIVFNRWVGSYLSGPGARGFGIPPTQNEVVEGAGDGAIPRFARRGERDIDIPVTIAGENRTEVHAAQRRLAAALRWKGPPAPLPRLQYTLESGAVYELGVYYVTGAETQIGERGGDSFCMWLLTLRAPDPYWVALNERSFTVRAGAGGRGLLPQLSKLRVSSSQVLGSITVNNPGDEESPVRWVVTGPGGPFQATLSGVGFVLDCDLDEGEQRIIDEKADPMVSDGDGENKYTELGTAPKLFSIPPGLSTVDVLLTSATSDSLVVGLYRPRLEVVF